MALRGLVWDNQLTSRWTAQGGIMGTANITIEVDEGAARAYSEASPNERQKLQLLLSLRLQELTDGSPKSLQTIMDEIGREAEARGLTPEILESLLRDQ